MTTAAAAVRNTAVAVAVALAFVCTASTAYPTSMERVPGDGNNNYPQPLRNSPSRDFDRFIDSCDDGDYECDPPARHGRPSTAAAATKRSSLDRLNGDLISLVGRCDGDGCGARRRADERDGPDDRVIGFARACDAGDGCGVRRTAKRSSLDRLNGDLISLVGRCDGYGCDASQRADKRNGLDDRPGLTPSWSAVSSSHTIDRLGGMVFVRRQPTTDAQRRQLSADVYGLLRRLELLADPSPSSSLPSSSLPSSSLPSSSLPSSSSSF